MTTRPPPPAWKDQPPVMAVVILAGTGPTAKAATYLREVESWLRAAKRQIPKDRPTTPGGTLFAASEGASK